MTDGFAKCPSPECTARVKPWPDQTPFCCHNCWEWFYKQNLRPDLAHELVGVNWHSDQCYTRQAARLKEQL